MNLICFLWKLIKSSYIDPVIIDIDFQEDHEKRHGHETSIKSVKLALMSDIFDWIIGKESENIEASSNYLSTEYLKKHIRTLAIQK